MDSSEKKDKNPDFVNPIDPDKISENPHSLTYGHHVGSAPIKAEDVGKQKGRSLTAMEHQTDQQLTQLYEQMQLLAAQAKKIQDRKTISTKIYAANFRFEPLINHVYYLYEDQDGQEILSMIAPQEWSKSKSGIYRYIATVKLLADHTWDILDQHED